MFKMTDTWTKATKELNDRLSYEDIEHDGVEQHINHILDVSTLVKHGVLGDFAAVAPHNDDVIGYVSVFNADEDGNQRPFEVMARSIADSIGTIAQNTPVSTTGADTVSVAVSVDYSWQGEHMTVQTPVDETGEINGEVLVYRAWQDTPIGSAPCKDLYSVACAVLSAYRSNYFADAA